MNKFVKKTKGAISLFLALLMLPLMSVASIFVDMSRINLAKAMGESAGDLTLNTALTNYDAELKTLYGLFATAQNMDEMMESLEDYYRQSIEAAGVDSYYAEDFAKKLVNSMKEETGTDDLMNIQLSGFDVEIPQGAHLGNPAIMKSQIVEFMKYRAPVNLGMGFLDALSSMKNLKKQMDVVENKNAYYKQHQSMLGHIETAWKPIQEYQYKDAAGNTGFPTGSYITDYAGYLTKDVEPLRKAVSDAVKYLYDRGNFVAINHKLSVEYACPECGAASTKDALSCSCGATWSVKTGNRVWKARWNSNETTLTSSYTKDNPATLNEVLKAYTNVRSQIQKIEEYGANTAVHKIAENTNTDPVVQIYLVCQLKSHGNAYLQAVKDLVQRMVHLNAAIMSCEDEKLATTKIKDVGNSQFQIDDNGTISLYSDAKNQLEKHMQADTYDYIRIFNTATSNSRSYVNTCGGTVSSAERTVREAIRNARNDAATFYKKISEKISNLSNAITSLESARTMLSSGGACTTAKNTWSTSAQGLGDDTMGQHDLDEIKEMEKNIDYNKVNTLITRLNAAKTSLQKVAEEIAKYSICGTAWKDITENPDYSYLTTMIKNKYGSEIDKIVPTGNGSYDVVIGKVRDTMKSGTVPTTWDSSNHPNLAPDCPALYAWMYNNFYDPNMKYNETSQTKEVNKADENLKNYKKEIETSKAEGHQDAANVAGSAGTQVNRDIKPYLEAANGLPSTRWDGEKAELAKAEIKGSADEMVASGTNDSFLETIMNLAVSLGRDLRDNLYVSEYIMTMFSYDTLEAEIFDQNNKDSNRRYEAFFKQEGEGWKAKDAFAAYAGQMKTQTKVPIDPDMNFLYGEEVEYILYGDGGKTGVYATIFALRFALNTVYAFTDAEINNATMAAATALFGTPPLTPLIPVAKAAMTIALALAESGWDLNELNKGKAIPMMKNKDTWVMKPSGIAKEVKEEAMTIAKDAANKAVDKGYEVLNKALTATSEEMDAIIASGEEGIGQLADAALRSAQSSLENYANQALQKVVELCNQVNQEFMTKLPGDAADDAKAFPGNMTEKVNNVKAKLTEWRDSQSGDSDIIKEVRGIAVDHLLQDGQIESLFNTIEAQAAPDAAMNLLHGKLDAIRGQISYKITAAIQQGGSALSKLKDDMVEELKGAAKEGADKLKEVLSSKVDDCFGKIATSDGAPKGASSGVVSSLLSWRYSDYLRLFVVVGLFANEELMLLRIADMIERNMQHKNNEAALVTSTETVTKSRFFGLIKYKQEKQVTSISDEAFTLSKSYTYVSLTAHLQVKPLFMTLPFMAETVENQLTGTNWYEITCTSMLGY